MENQILETIQKFIEKLGCGTNKMKIEFDKSNRVYKVNIDSNETSLLIGHHGETIQAIQHLVKHILWKMFPDQEFDLYIDIDSYKKRQEESVIKLAERKVEMARKLSSPQSLPAMSPYFRRVIHLHLAQEKFNDVKTESHGEGDYRYIIIKPQLII